MSGNPKDDQHDDAVDSAWSREFREEPSATTDAVIRAAARRELASRREQRVRYGWLGHWTPIAAAAAVGVLAFGIVRWLPVDQELATVSGSRTTESDENLPTDPGPGVYDSVQTPTPAEETAERAGPPAPQGSPLQSPAQAPAAERRERMTGPSRAPLEAADRVTVQEEHSPSPGPPVATPPTPTSQSQEVPGPATPESAPATAAAEAAVSSNSARSGPVAPAAKTAERPDEAVSTATRQAIRRITELYTAGRIGDAAEALRALRVIEPRADDLLSPELRPWAATVTD